MCGEPIDTGSETSWPSTKDRVEFYNEFLDVARFPGEEQRQRYFFIEKYPARTPDLLIAVSGGALKFLVKYRSEVFAGVPIVYCSVAEDPRPNPLSETGIADVRVPNGVIPTLEIMLRLHPDTRHVAVVSGSGRRTGSLPMCAVKRLLASGTGVSFTWLTDPSMEHLRGELSRLRDHTVVLYLTMFQDAVGRSESYQTVPMFDWHRLQRWKISQQRLPPGSIVWLSERAPDPGGGRGANAARPRPAR
jgi:hypothetical protein